jgi:importin subunit alpha-6/7
LRSGRSIVYLTLFCIFFWFGSNIVAGTSEHTKVVVEGGAVPFFVRLLMNPNDDVREKAVAALGNIAGDSPPYRDLVLQAGAMQQILNQVNENSKPSMVRIATRTLSNFCRGKPQPDFELVRPSLPTLSNLVFSLDVKVLTYACRALSYLSNGPYENIQSVIESGVCRRLVELLLNRSSAVQAAALRAVGNIVTGNDLQTQYIINMNAVICLWALLLSPKMGIREEACWAIGNITGTYEYCSLCLDGSSTNVCTLCLFTQPETRIRFKKSLIPTLSHR